ncbi:MAG: DUF1450 domain-containing protein [Geobacteraceae bacterium]|nr:DUF1450 domain-containing protein [Geobacteraceae bacterium]
MKVRLCDKNKGKSKIEKRLAEKMPDVDVKVKKCIDICDECSKNKIARVDGKKIVAKDGDELYEKVKKAIRKD